MRSTPRSFLLDLLATLPRGTMPVAALVESAAQLGISENRLRVALTRLRAAGLVESDARGRYRLGEAARPVASRAADWRRLGERVSGWDGGWIGVRTTPWPARGAARRAADRALRLHGFRAFDDALAVRPDNLSLATAMLRDELAALGLPPGTLVFTLRDLDAASEARARTLWDAAALRRGYRDSLAALERSAARLARLGEATAMTESFELGGRVIRQLVLDPLLPDALVPAAQRDALVAAMQRYDALGRAAWRAFLERHDVIAPRRAPADLRIGEPRGALAIA